MLTKKRKKICGGGLLSLQDVKVEIFIWGLTSVDDSHEGSNSVVVETFDDVTGELNKGRR